ncbi:hypothetical protein BASA81_002084 [Batrachochytrium salamandrivorans]|nr:hypothetical protein BASA81_002084 [Batrachochytrium salamandrivorans]
MRREIENAIRQPNALAFAQHHHTNQMPAPFLALLCLAAAAYQVEAKTFAGWGNSFFYLQPDGQIFGFGKNTLGALGINSLTNAPFPTQMLNVGFATDVASGDGHTCIVDSGAARCTGQGTYGQLAREDRQASPVLLPITSLESGVSEVFNGAQFSCAVLTAGGVRCWGYNLYGAIGDNTKVTKYAVVTPIGYGTVPVREVGMGSYQACLLTVAGKVVCAGQNIYQQFGASFGEYALTMSPIWSLSSGLNYVSISCGLTSCCTVSDAGKVFCWGSNGAGQLGVTGISTTAGIAPVQPNGLDGLFVSSVWVRGNSAFFVVGPDNTIMATGANAKGVLGLGDTTDRSAIASFAGGKTNINQIRGGLLSTCVLDAAGSVQCVGDNAFGQLGLGTTTSTLTMVDPMLPSSSPTMPVPGTDSPTVQPTAQPTVQPTAQPTAQPTTQPTAQPTAQPTSQPTAQPTSQPTAQPTSQPAAQPTTPSETDTSEADNNANAGVVAAAVVVPIAVLLILGAALMAFCTQRRRNQRAKHAQNAKIGELGIQPHGNGTANSVEVHPSRENSRNTSNNVPPQVMV